MNKILIKNKNDTFNIDIEKLLKTLEKYKIKVFELKKIQYGWKNICFSIKTINNKKLFIKCFDTKKAINNEIQIYKIVKETVSVPKLFYAIKSKDLNILVYEYVLESIPFFEYEKHINNQNIEEIFSNIAKSLAIIHNIRSDKYNKLNVPDFSSWYKIFLTKNNVIKQLGYKRKNKIEWLDNYYKKFFSTIEEYKSFCHCDFKSNNILIKNDLSPCIIDWEFASYCYSFLDIGQLFREKEIYSNKFLINIFQESYNNIANKNLPDNWDIFIKLVDLGNLLEMLSRKIDLEQNKKVIKVIDDYLDYLTQ